MLRLILLRLLESYFRHRWLYLLPIVMMMGVAAIYYQTLEPVYVTRGVLHVEQESLISSLNSVTQDGYSRWLTPSKLTADRLTELMNTDAFIRAMIQQTDLESEMNEGSSVVEQTIKDVRNAVVARPVGNNQVVVSASHEEAQIAYQLVNAAIETQIKWQINSSINESVAAEDFFNSLIGEYYIDLEIARNDMEAFLIENPAPIRGGRLGIEQLELDQLQSASVLAESRYANAIDKQENARLAKVQVESDARQRYFMIDAPQLPDEPETSLTDTVVMVMVFVALGGVLAIVGVVGGALIDRSLRFPIDVYNGLNLPVLANVPNVREPKRRWYRRRKKDTVQEGDTAVSQHAKETLSPAFVATDADVTGSNVEKATA